MALLFSFYLFWLYERFFPREPSYQFALFSTEDDDRLDHHIASLIKRAENSLKFAVYTWNEERLENELEKKLRGGVSLSIDHDSGAKKLKKLRGAALHEMNYSGIFHEKIVISDQKEVWISSANFTETSFLLDSNLALYLKSNALAKSIEERKSAEIEIRGTKISYYPLPESKKGALSHLITEIEKAQSSIGCALFTITHPKIIDSLIDAHKRGVDVEINTDRKMAFGAGKSAALSLIEAKVPFYILGSNKTTFHHKFMLIDKKTLIFGSANFSRAAFEKNGECLLIISPLPKKEEKKMEKVLKVIENTREEMRFE